MKHLLAGLFVLIAFSGCLSDDDAPPTDTAGTNCNPTPFEDAGIRMLATTDDPLNDNRDELQWDHESYNVRTCSLAAVGHHPLRFSADGTGEPHRYLGELDTLPEHNLAVVAALGNGETPTAYLLDITDRLQPVVLSTIEQVGTYMTDVKLSPDGRYLATASQGTLVGTPELAELPALTANAGFTLYDLADPTNPAYMATYVEPAGGCHMLAFEIVADTHVVACVADNVHVWGFVEQGQGTLVPLGYVPYFPQNNGVPTPSSGLVNDPTCLGPTGCLLPPGTVSGLLTNGPHDMTISRDPDGSIAMVVSHWNDGLRVVDITNAPQATEVGAWFGEGATHYDGNVHSGMMFWAEGQRYVMASPEYTYGGQVPSLWVLDAANYGQMSLVGEWFHPNEHESQGLYHTTHQWQVAPTGPDVPLSDVHVYLTMNHGGVWVLGLEEILAGDNWGAIKGFHLSRAPLDPETAVGNAVLNTWDVNVVDGAIYGTDRATGLWIFDYDGDDELSGVTGFA